jgi:signal transduction histidine kinase
MNRSEALALLKAASPHERLRAARVLASTCQIDDLPELRKARQTESVSYVRKSLDLAIARSVDLMHTDTLDSVSEPEVPSEIRQQIRTQAVEWVAGMLLHEIATPVGLVRKAASSEVPDFANSRTKAHLDHLTRLFEGIEQLKAAAVTPRLEEFDLATLVAEVIAGEESEGAGVQISVQGPRPLIVGGDPRLLRLAICNGLRNAIEAVRDANSDDSRQVIINWGETDIDYWLVLIDCGPGLVGPIDAAFKIGTTTKSNHIGFGLAITRQALDTLGGTVTLQPAHSGGARLEIRWGR